MNIYIIIVIVVSISYLLYRLLFRNWIKGFSLYSMLLQIFNKSWVFLIKTVKLPANNDAEISVLQYEMSIIIATIAEIAFTDNSIKSPSSTELASMEIALSIWEKTISKNNGISIDKVQKDYDNIYNQYRSAFTKCLQHVDVRKDLSQEFVTDYQQVWHEMRKPNSSIQPEQYRKNSEFISNAIHSRYALFNLFISRCISSHNQYFSFVNMIDSQGKLSQKGQVIALQFFDLFYTVYIDVYSKRKIHLKI